MKDYGWEERKRLLRNQQHEELGESLANWLLFITIVYLTIHVVLSLWG